MEVAVALQNAGGGFVRQGNGAVIYVREGRPLSSFWHEFEHYRHWQEMLATDPTGVSYWRIPRIQKEERVFRALFENETVWRLMTPTERQTQIDSLKAYMADYTTLGSAARQRIQQLITEAEAGLNAPTFSWR